MKFQSVAAGGGCSLWSSFCSLLTVLASLSSWNMSASLAFVPEPIRQGSPFPTTLPTLSRRMPSVLRYELESNSGNGNSNDNSNNDDNNSPNNKDNQEQEEARRMAVVRSLQMSFYKPSATASSRAASFPQSQAQEASTAQSLSSSSSSSSTTGTSDENRNSITDTPTTFDASTGILYHLPLWRAPWQEVPGRTNVLNVHDPIYTSMFESILYSQTNNNNNNNNNKLYFGHLFLQGGSRNLSRKAIQDDPNYQLQAFETDDSSTMDDASSASSSSASFSSSSLSQSAILGCLMHIQDYRRMADGRLLLLVHASERFVVTKIHQQLPYSVVDAQIIPDVEETASKIITHHIVLPKAPTTSTKTTSTTTTDTMEELAKLSEFQVAQARAQAIQESVLDYQDYEYDPHQVLQLPDGPTFSVADVSHAAIAKVLPYCPYNGDNKHKTFPLQNNKQFNNNDSNNDNNDDDQTVSTITSTFTSIKDQHDENENNNNMDQQRPLECQLLRQGILQIPPSDPEFVDRFRQHHGRNRNNHNPHYTYSTGSRSRTVFVGDGDYSSSQQQTKDELSNDELEQELWVAVNQFLLATQKPISPILLSLLPPMKEKRRHWPKGFVLHKIAAYVAQKQQRERHNDDEEPSIAVDARRNNNNKVLNHTIIFDHEYVPLHSDYPAHRRQRRFSFSAAYLLESGDAPQQTQQLRALLLSIPSTHQRLKVVLEKFYQWQKHQQLVSHGRLVLQQDYDHRQVDDDDDDDGDGNGQFGVFE